MSRIKTLQALFKRYRRPGDIVFASLFLAISIYLLTQLGDQTARKAGAKLFAQPGFWPAISLIGMTAFAALHLLGSVLSDRIKGRWREVGLWLSSIEYALWFMAYALVVPFAGYLPSTVLFAVLLILRAGYRSRNLIVGALVSALLIVVLFKSFLQVKLPAGRIYDALPDAIRPFMLIYF